VGFEPTVTHKATTVFETVPFNRSGTSPGACQEIIYFAPNVAVILGTLTRNACLWRRDYILSQLFFMAFFNLGSALECFVEMTVTISSPN
jgi:hypothetical protein